MLSFVFLGIYWSNHHHLVHLVERVNGGVLWANLHLLFWLSLVPFVTAWMGANHYSAVPTALYGVVMVFASIAYTILEYTIIAAQGPDSKLARAIGSNRKGMISLALYVAAIPARFRAPTDLGRALRRRRPGVASPGPPNRTSSAVALAGPPVHRSTAALRVPNPLRHFREARLLAVHQHSHTIDPRRQPHRADATKNRDDDRAADRDRRDRREPHAQSA